MTTNVCGLALGAAIVATFTWPEVVVAIVVAVCAFLVLGCIACAAWEGYWTWRKEQADLARDRQARDDKAVRTWMDSEDAA